MRPRNIATTLKQTITVHEPSVHVARYRGDRVELLTRPWKRSDLSVANEVLERRCYEKHKVCLSHCRHWLDAGGHIGCFAIAAALSGCRVDSFEPEPDNADLFEQNIGDVRPLVTLHRAALLSEPTVQETTLYLAPRSTSFHSTVAPFKTGGSVRVPVVGFEAFLHENPSIDGLKLDVQGAEMPMLESLCKHPDLLAQLKQIAFEWDFQYDKKTARLCTVLDSLQAAGFEVFAPSAVRRFPTWDHWPSGVLVHARRPRGSLDGLH